VNPPRHPTPEDLIEAIADHLVNASTSYDIWREMQNGDRQNEYEPAVSAHPVFFETLAVSQLVAISALLYAVNETRKDTHNFSSLLKATRSTLPSAIELNSAASRLQQVHDLWVKISRVRNEVFAHRSTARSPEGVFAELALRPDDIGFLIREFKEVLRSIAQLLCLDIPPSLDLNASYETEEVMLVLARAGAP
jgi:hypothetical protein